METRSRLSLILLAAALLGLANAQIINRLYAPHGGLHFPVWNSAWAPTTDSTTKNLWITFDTRCTEDLVIHFSGESSINGTFADRYEYDHGATFSGSRAARVVFDSASVHTRVHVGDKRWYVFPRNFESFCQSSLFKSVWVFFNNEKQRIDVGIGSVIGKDIYSSSYLYTLLDFDAKFFSIGSGGRDVTEVRNIKYGSALPSVMVPGVPSGYFPWTADWTTSSGSLRLEFSVDCVKGFRIAILDSSVTLPDILTFDSTSTSMLEIMLSDDTNTQMAIYRNTGSVQTTIATGTNTFCIAGTSRTVIFTYDSSTGAITLSAAGSPLTGTASGFTAGYFAFGSLAASAQVSSLAFYSTTTATTTSTSVNQTLPTLSFRGQAVKPYLDESWKSTYGSFWLTGSLYCTSCGLSIHLFNQDQLFSTITMSSTGSDSSAYRFTLRNSSIGSSIGAFASTGAFTNGITSTTTSFCTGSWTDFWIAFNGTAGTLQIGTGNDLFTNARISQTYSGTSLFPIKYFAIYPDCTNGFVSLRNGVWSDTFPGYSGVQVTTTASPTTAAPTATPTEAPTLAPTEAPTLAPSPSPTVDRDELLEYFEEDEAETSAAAAEVEELEITKPSGPWGAIAGVAALSAFLGLVVCGQLYYARRH